MEDDHGSSAVTEARLNRSACIRARQSVCWDSSSRSEGAALLSSLIIFRAGSGLGDPNSAYVQLEARRRVLMRCYLSSAPNPGPSERSHV